MSRRTLIHVLPLTVTHDDMHAYLSCPDMKEDPHTGDLVYVVEKLPNTDQRVRFTVTDPEDPEGYDVHISVASSPPLERLKPWQKLGGVSRSKDMQFNGQIDVVAVVFSDPLPANEGTEPRIRHGRRRIVFKAQGGGGTGVIYMHDSAKRALIVGSPFGEMAGVETSVKNMREFLADELKFTCEVVSGPDADRRSILAALRRLVAATLAGDAVVFYYAGHGELFHRQVIGRDRSVRVEPMVLPMDVAESSDVDFRGILGAELGLMILALARKTANVTAILDCCHAARILPRITLDEEAAVERGLHELAAEVGAHIATRRTRGAPATSLQIPWDRVVRVVACAAGETSYATAACDRLLFTTALLDTLRRALPGAWTWDAIVRDVRAQVQREEPSQRPGVDGASERTAFSDKPGALLVDHFHVRSAGKTTSIDAGAAAGISEGDEFELRPYLDTEAPPILTQARQVLVDRTVLAVPPAARLAPVMTAHRTGRPCSLTLHIEGDADGALAHALGEAIVTVVSDRAAASVRISRDNQWIVHADDRRWCFAETDALARHLGRLGKWRALHAQIHNPAPGPLTGAYSLKWRQRRGPDAAPFAPGDLLRGELELEIDNPGRAAALHVHGFRVSDDLVIDPWPHAISGGHEVPAGRTLALRDPVDLRAQTSAREWLVVALGDGSFDLDGIVTARKMRSSRSTAARRVELIGLPYTREPPPAAR